MRWMLGLAAAAVAAGAAETTPAGAAGPAGVPPVQNRWTPDQAWEWVRSRPWTVGFNYVPSTACNTTEFWAAETFDEATIDRELGWGSSLGFNACRVFVQYLVWKQAPEGLKARFERFLALAERHGLTVVPVLFDDCAFGDPPQTEPSLGRQRDPTPGMILPSWTPSPGLKAVTDPATWPDLERYVRDLVGAFARERRILMWDLYNEPGNSGLGNRSLPLVEATFAWARAAGPTQPLTTSPWGAPAEISQRQLELSDVTSFHYYGPAQGLHAQIARYKGLGRPVINTEWMARPLGSRWDTDLPFFRAEGTGCFSWGLVNGRTQCQFAWYHPRGTPEPEVWFHDLFHADGRPYDIAEHEAIRAVTSAPALDWNAADYRTMITPPPSAQSPRPRMLYGDASRHGRPFAKDPSVIELGGRYLMYYSMAPATDPAKPKGWAIGIAESRDLVGWRKAGEILPEQECERNGIVNGAPILIGGTLHLFYNTYGNGRSDALCHATSSDGLTFRRDPTNPIVRPTGDWNSGRAIDCDAFVHGDRLFLLYATRDPSMNTQMLVAATAPLGSDFGRAAWTQVGDGPVLRPELPWETRCIEAPSVVRHGDVLYLFYGGGYNNDPQQIGCATSPDGVHWTRLFHEPLIPNGQPDDWNASETGHPGVFVDRDGRTWLFVQGNRDRGQTWFLSCFEIAWRNERPFVLWDSPRFPMKRPGPMPHHEAGFDFSAGWTCWTGHGPRRNGLHYCNTAEGTATVRFEGTGIALVHKVGPDCGIAEIRVDGQPPPRLQAPGLSQAANGTVLLDTFSPQVEWNRITPLVEALPPGPHTLTLRVTGQRHPQSSNTYVQLVEAEPR